MLPMGSIILMPTGDMVGRAVSGANTLSSLDGQWVASIRAEIGREIVGGV